MEINLQITHESPPCESRVVEDAQVELSDLKEQCEVAFLVTLRIFKEIMQPEVPISVSYRSLFSSYSNLLLNRLQGIYPMFPLNLAKISRNLLGVQENI